MNTDGIQEIVRIRMDGVREALDMCQRDAGSSPEGATVVSLGRQPQVLRQEMGCAVTSNKS